MFATRSVPFKGVQHVISLAHTLHVVPRTQQTPEKCSMKEMRPEEEELLHFPEQRRCLVGEGRWSSCWLWHPNLFKLYKLKSQTMSPQRTSLSWCFHLSRVCLWSWKEAAGVPVQTGSVIPRWANSCASTELHGRLRPVDCWEQEAVSGPWLSFPLVWPHWPHEHPSTGLILQPGQT